MKSASHRLLKLLLLSALALTALSLWGCASRPEAAPAAPEARADTTPDTSLYLVAVEDEPDTVDFQCTSIHYTVAQNVFNRLVEMDSDPDGAVTIRPALAESWEVSDDGRRYTFRLRDGVRFSNGATLTASDVDYTFHRLLTHPDSCNRDIAEEILGADKLAKGEAERLEGFEIIDDLTFAITLRQPFEAFLACLSMPGASILDEDTTRAAGDRFGLDPACTVGTGSFILREWVPGQGLLLTANPDCWEGPPKCAGLDLRFMTEPEEIRMLFEAGGLDVLDLDEVGNSVEYFIHGDIYRDRLYTVPRIGTTYIALNETVKPLDDARVRKALQLALNRVLLLDAVYSGRGSVENGIYPHGLYGFNPDLPAIPYDPAAAKALLAEAGCAEGFDLTLSVNAASTQWEMTLMRMVVSMWEECGVRATIEVLEDDEFMPLRKSGELACYSATWTADYNDPDNFIYTFFGSRGNTRFRSLCYQDEDVMARVRAARRIVDADARLEEYRELERKIVQEDAAWIPLFSRLRYYVTSERTSGIQSSWNGSVKNKYREFTIRDTH